MPAVITDRRRAATVPGFGSATAALHGWVGLQQDRFVLWLPVFQGAGILAYFASNAEPRPWLGPAALALAIAATAAGWRWPLVRAMALGAVAASLGFAAAQLAAARAPPWEALPRHAVVVTAHIIGVEALPQGRRLTLAAPSLDGALPLGRWLRLRLRDTDATPLHPGDTVQVRALIRPPSPPAYPGAWDPQRDAYFAGQAGSGFAIGASMVVANGASHRWQAFRESIAAHAIAGLPGERGAIAATLLTGLPGAIPAADRAAFQDSGLAHLLAVAGLHIGIVMALTLGFTRFGLASSEHAALHWPIKQVAGIAALAAGGFYLALTGGHVPILRSFAMASLALLGLLAGRRAVSLRGLALAACVLLAISPVYLLGVSFQLSFSAVLALIAGYQTARPWLARIGVEKPWRKPALYVGGLALTSLLAGTASAPFAAYQFGRATLYYIPANMVAVPLTALWVMPWSLGALLLMPLGLEHLALVPAGWGIALLIAIARGVAAWPGSTLNVPQIPGWGVALVALGMAWLGLWRGRTRAAGVLPLLLGLLSPLFAAPPAIVLAASGHLMVARVGGLVVSESDRRPDAFELRETLRLWGAAQAVPLPGFGTLGDGAAVCRGGSCRLRLPAGTVLVARDGAAPDCAEIAAVVALGPARPCPAPLLRPRYGVATVYGGPGLAATDASSGLRPWAYAAGASKRQDTAVPAPNLPPAASE